MYQALLTVCKNSLNALKSRVCGPRGGEAAANQTPLNPLFEVVVQLDGDQCRLIPPLDFIQTRVNKAASAILTSMKDIKSWNQKDISEEEK